MPIYVIGPLRIDTHRMVATAPWGMIKLTGAEWVMLELLARSAPSAVSREEISAAALRRPWGGTVDRTTDQLALSLRRKLPLDDTGLPMIRNVRAAGFFMRCPDLVE